MRHQKSAASLAVNSYFPKIVAKKHLKARALLTTAQANVLSLCNAYPSTLRNLTTPKQQAWSDETNEALKSCYAVSTKALSEHKDAILKSLQTESPVNVQRCAYCMLNDPQTWDHYLPKEGFPEYSVYHENLVYVCYGCNQRKSCYFDANGLIYCHPYFTVDAEEALLHCKVTVVSSKLSIQYYGAGSGAFEDMGLIAHQHLKRLHLIDRFKSEASSTVAGLIGELRQHYPRGIKALSLERVLERRYIEARSKLGCNAWDSRLWHGLAHCQNFLSYVNGKIAQPSAPSIRGFRQLSPPLPP